MNPANWSMPDWKAPNFRSIVPGQKKTITKKAIPKSNKSGPVDRFGKTVSHGFNRTKVALDPKKLNPKRLLPKPKSTPESKAPPKSSKPEKPGFWGSLFVPEPKDSAPKTMQDWVGGDRPGM
jgi:hypothetical protein